MPILSKYEQRLLQEELTAAVMVPVHRVDLYGCRVVKLGECTKKSITKQP